MRRTDEHEALLAAVALLLIELEYGTLDASGETPTVTFEAPFLLMRMRSVWERMPAVFRESIEETIANGPGWLQLESTPTPAQR